MSEPASGSADLPRSGALRTRSLLERLSNLLLRAPEDREQLIELLRQARERELLDADALTMIEGVLQVADMTARDIMVPRAHVDTVDTRLAPAEFVAAVVDSGHSRLPVIDGELDRVVGIVHAKDLLRFELRHAGDGDETQALRALVRPAVFIPESKRLNDLLRDFRANRNHIAIVVDEYGGVSGVVTIEDVLEQIVGDIEDEFDLEDEDADLIVAADPGDHGPRWRVQARTPIALLNERFGTTLSDTDCDTVGGLLSGALGRVPEAGDTALLDGLRFEVLSADARQVHLLMVERAPARPDVASDAPMPADDDPSLGLGSVLDPDEPTLAPPKSPVPDMPPGSGSSAATSAPQPRAARGSAAAFASARRSAHATARGAAAGTAETARALYGLTSAPGRPRA